MRTICLLLVVSLSACATLSSNEVQVVDKAVAVSCVDELPETPRFYADAELKAMSDYQVTITLLVERIQRESYESTLQVLLQACK